MGTRTSHAGKVRSYGGRQKSNVTPGTAVLTLIITGDPTATAGTSAADARAGTSATVGPLAILPKGAIPLRIQTLGGATGGASPTVDVGLTINGVNDQDGLRNELDADTPAGSGLDCNGAQGAAADMNVGITHDSQVTLSVGASAATGGATSFLLMYAMADDGKDSESE